MSVSHCLVVFLLLALSLCRGFFAAPPTCPPSDVDGVEEVLRSPQRPLWIERSFSNEVNGDTLDKELAHPQDGTYHSVFSYASWRPFSQKFRSVFDTLSSRFRQIRHLAVEQYSAMPSVFSRYGIHGFRAFVLTSRTASIRYHGLKYLDSSVGFYRKLTELVEKLAFSILRMEPIIQCFFYASWRPFSQKFRSIFDTLSSMFRQTRHLAAMPSVFSRYGIHGFCTFVLTSRTTSVRYLGLKYIDFSVGFYRELTELSVDEVMKMKKTNL